LTCAGLVAEHLPVRFVPLKAMQPPCTLAPGLVLRRSLVSGEVLRPDDIGPVPDVSARSPVSVRVVVGHVALEKAGTALADAQLGDTVRVRLNGSSRRLDGRVVAHRVVVLEGSE
jgi:flagella basal body P-ring formation protein FlgA